MYFFKAEYRIKSATLWWYSGCIMLVSIINQDSHGNGPQMPLISLITSKLKQKEHLIKFTLNTQCCQLNKRKLTGQGCFQIFEN